MTTSNGSVDWERLYKQWTSINKMISDCKRDGDTVCTVLKIVTEMAMLVTGEPFNCLHHELLIRWVHLIGVIRAGRISSEKVITALQLIIDRPHTYLNDVQMMYPQD